MSQEVMNELVNMSQEIFKLKDQRRELLEALKEAAAALEVRCAFGDADKARAAISKAEGAQ